MDMSKQYNRETFMLSRYTGNCNVCGIHMPVGTEIAYGGRKGTTRHVRCNDNLAVWNKNKYD